MMQYRRIVDLTQPLVPGQGTRPLVIERGRTEELTVHAPVDHPWYIMHRVQTISHIGRTSRRQIAAKLGIAASTESRLTHVFEDPALAVAIADGMITKSQAQELLVAPPEDRPRLICLVDERRKAEEPLSLRELRSEVAGSRPHVALRNTPLPQLAATGAHPFSTEEARVLSPSPEGIAGSLSTARRQAQVLRQTVEEQLPLLSTSLDDPEVAANLNRIHESLSRILGKSIH